MKPGKYRTSFVGTEYPVYYIQDTTEAVIVLQKLTKQDDGEVYGLDTETEALPEFKYCCEAALSPYLSKIRLMQIFTGRTALVLDLKYISPKAYPVIKHFLEAKRFVLQNAVFDLQYFYKQFNIKHINAGCTMLASKLLFHAVMPVDGQSASLKSLVELFFHVDLSKADQTSDWSVPELTWEQIEYSALDAISVYHLSSKLAEKINKFGLEKVYKLYKDAQIPIVKMQLNGIKLDIVKHRDLIVKWRSELNESRKEVARITGLKYITPHSVASYLEKTLSKDLLEIWPRTETGKLQTDAHVFSDFEFVDVIKPFAVYQKNEKLCTSFGDTLIKQVNMNSYRLHPQYRLCGTRTGRLSCSAPNLQQSPRIKEFRSNFIPEEGNKFVLADYSSVEVRAAAELSGDVRMLDAFKKGIDIYKATAAGMLHKKVEEVTKEERQRMKAIVLGLQFGLGQKKLGAYAKRNYKIEITDEEAKDQVKAYRQLYPQFRAWQLEQVSKAAENNYTSRTVTGKLRKYDPEAAFGNVINHCVQGSCAEAMLYSLIYLDKNLPSKCKLIGTVHDEIIIETTFDRVANTKDMLNYCMIEGYKTVFPSGATVKGLVEATEGSSWMEAKK